MRSFVPPRSGAADRKPAARPRRPVAGPRPAQAPRQFAGGAGPRREAPAPALPAAQAADGLPEGLQLAMEAMSGFSLADVVVHRNSAEPARLGAAAFTKGSQIHVAPGQERHLPHEAWHVVQQAQGRVRPTMQMKGGVPVNDDAELEREADVMGARALSGSPLPPRDPASAAPGRLASWHSDAIQRMKHLWTWEGWDPKVAEDRPNQPRHFGTFLGEEFDDETGQYSKFDLARDKIPEKTEIADQDESGILITTNFDLYFPHGHADEDHRYKTYFENYFSKEGTIEFRHNYREVPDTPFYATDVLKHQLAVAQENGFCKAVNKIQRIQVSNPTSIRIMTEPRFDEADGKGKLTIFLAETPNGKSTQWIMKATGLIPAGELVILKKSGAGENTTFDVEIPLERPAPNLQEAKDNQ